MRLGGLFVVLARRSATVIAGLVLVVSVAGCGGRTSRVASDGGGSASCPDISGAWVIADHCQASAVGGGLTVTQTGCSITSSGTFPPGWTGTVNPEGGITMTGPGGEMTLTCTGNVTGGTITMNCAPGTCNVRLTR